MINSSEICTAFDLEEIELYVEYCVVILFFSIIGIFTNSISILIFISFSNTKKKFFHLLKYYTLNSIVSNLNDFVIMVFLIRFRHQLLIDTSSLQIYNQNHNLIRYIVYFYLIVRNTVYTFGCSLDLFIIYERIQLYAPNYSFLIKQSAGRIVGFVFLYVIVLNVPTNMSRQVRHIEKCKESESTFFYYFDSPDFNEFFIIFLIITYIIRDAITCIIMIVLITILIICVRRYYTQRQTFNMQNRNSNIIFKKSALNNCKIAVMMCFLNVILHILNAYNLIKKHQYNSAMNDIVVYSIFFEFKNSVNIFIFIKFNKIFKRNFLMMVPRSNIFGFSNNSNNSNVLEMKLSHTERRNSRDYSTRL